MDTLNHTLLVNNLIRIVLIGQLRESNGINMEVGAAIIANGMAEYKPEDDRSVADVFARADSAMYDNKKELKAMR